MDGCDLGNKIFIIDDDMIDDDTPQRDMDMIINKDTPQRGACTGK